METRIAGNFDDSVETGVFARPRADNVIVETVLIGAKRRARHTSAFPIRDFVVASKIVGADGTWLFMYPGHHVAHHEDGVSGRYRAGFAAIAFETFWFVRETREHLCGVGNWKCADLSRTALDAAELDVYDGGTLVRIVYKHQIARGAGSV